MLLSEIFEQLNYGELSQTILGGDPGRGTQECDYPTLIPHVNLALNALHTRFDLRRDTVDIIQIADLHEYILDKRFAVSNTASTEPVKYIMDTAEKPYLDTSLRIETVTNVEDGSVRTLNDATDETSDSTPSLNTLFIKKPVPDALLTLSFRSKHPELSAIGLEPANLHVALPYGLLEALLYFIGSRVAANRNADQNAEAQFLMQQYELACMRVSDKGLTIIQNNTNMKLDAAGWV